MFSITLDVGDTPTVLSALADPRLQDKLVKAGAQTYVDEMLDWIEAGKGFKSRSGILEQSIDWRFAGDASAEVFASAEYAGYVEHGTKSHVIKPKAGRKALKIASGNGFFFAKQINHPGSKPHPFFFADRTKRENKIKTKMISVLAAQMEKAGG